MDIYNLTRSSEQTRILLSFYFNNALGNSLLILISAGRHKYKRYRSLIKFKKDFQNSLVATDFEN